MSCVEAGEEEEEVAFLDLDLRFGFGSGRDIFSISAVERQSRKIS